MRIWRRLTPLIIIIIRLSLTHQSPHCKQSHSSTIQTRFASPSIVHIIIIAISIYIISTKQLFRLGLNHHTLFSMFSNIKMSCQPIWLLWILFFNFFNFQVPYCEAQSEGVVGFKCPQVGSICFTFVSFWFLLGVVLIFWFLLVRFKCPQVGRLDSFLCWFILIYFCWFCFLLCLVSIFWFCADLIGCSS